MATTFEGSSLSAFTGALRGVACALKAHQDTKAAARARALIKGALRNSPSEAMLAVRAAVLEEPGHERALEPFDPGFFLELLDRRARVEARRIYGRMPEAARADVAGLARVAVEAAVRVASPEAAAADPRWSGALTAMLGKRVDISAATAARLNALLDLARSVASELRASDDPAASAEDLDGLDVEAVMANGAAGPPLPADNVVRELLARLPDVGDLDLPGLVDRAPEYCASEGARPYVGFLHKVCRRIDATLVESLLSKALAQVRTGSVADLMESLGALDPAPFAREAGVLLHSIRQAEVLESLRNLLAGADPKVLRAALGVAVGNNRLTREHASDILRKVVASNAFPGLAARVPDIFRPDNSIDLDALVQAITRPSRAPPAPRLRSRLLQNCG